MSHMTDMLAPSILLNFILMTSHAVLALILLTTYEKVSEKSLTEPEMTLSTLSVIHCAIKCKQYPHCKVFAYDHQLSMCLLRSAMSATKGSANISTDNRLSVYKDTAQHCPNISLNISHGSVTIQRSLWSVEGNVTCDDDYLLLQTVTSAVTCLDDGSWSSINAQCVKRVWRYPETKMSLSQVTFAIPGTVVEGWSMCVEGVPTNNTYIRIEIYQGYNNNRTVVTTWQFEGYLQVTDSVRGKYGATTNVTSPPFPLVVGTPFFFRLTVNNSTTADIYMNNVFFYQHVLRYPLFSFSHMHIFGASVNVTKVEAWCRD